VQHARREKGRATDSQQQVGLVFPKHLPDVADVAAEPQQESNPHRDPQRRAGDVAEQEAAPGNVEAARQNPVNLSQPFKEPRQDDHPAAVLGEESLRLREPFGRDPDVAPYCCKTLWPPRRPIAKPTVPPSTDATNAVSATGSSCSSPLAVSQIATMKKACPGTGMPKFSMNKKKKIAG